MPARRSLPFPLLSVLGLAVLSGGPASAQGAFTFPCAVDPADNTAENGVGAEMGAEPREFCSVLSIPQICTLDGYYLIGSMSVGLTRTTGSPTMTFTNQVRTGPLGGGPPTAVVAGPFPRQATNVPVFPNHQRYVRDLILATLPETRFSVGFDAIELTSACSQYSGSMNSGQFMSIDESSGTPLTNCYTSINGNPVTDPCENGVPDLRATTQGLFVAPVGGPASGSREVPPSGSAGRGVCLAVADDPTPPGRVSLYVQVLNMASPFGAHVHRGRKGVNGPIAFTFPSPPAPNGNGVSASWDGVDASVLDGLEHGDFYINFHTAANPGGEIRCQLEAATQIFADGFESGDTSSWSNTQPRPGAP